MFFPCYKLHPQMSLKFFQPPCEVILTCFKRRGDMLPTRIVSPLYFPFSSHFSISRTPLLSLDADTPFTWLSPVLHLCLWLSASQYALSGVSHLWLFPVLFYLMAHPLCLRGILCASCGRHTPCNNAERASVNAC